MERLGWMFVTGRWAAVALGLFPRPFNRDAANPKQTLLAVVEVSLRLCKENDVAPGVLPGTHAHRNTLNIHKLSAERRTFCLSK